MALAEVYDALASQRVYEPPFPHQLACAMIVAERGRHFHESKLRKQKSHPKVAPEDQAPNRSAALEDRRNALATADAHRHQRIPPAAALQFVQRLGGDDGAGGAHRVAQ